MVTKVNAVKVSKAGELGANTKNYSDEQNLEKKIEIVDENIPNTGKLVKKTVYNTKIADIENEMPSINGLVTTTAFKAKVTKIENKMPDTSHFINTQELNRLTEISLDERMKEAIKSLAS